MLAAGTRLGPYEILAPLGAGGMGEVYRARDVRLGRDVAIKVLPPHAGDRADARARFEREARTVGALNHPHICALYDVGREGDADYLVLELITGESLAQRLARGALPIPEALRLGAQIADALGRAHEAGVVHRDLTPANVMLTRTGAKLVDFGLARLTLPESGGLLAGEAPTLPAQATMEGVILGTAGYLAPEQIRGQKADPRADLFALGAMLFEMVTGRRAFAGDSVVATLHAILTDEPPPLSSLVPAAPAGLARAVRTCLAKDPEERWQSARDLARELRWLADEAEGTRGRAGERAAGATRPPWLIPAALALALVVLVLVVLELVTTRGNPAAPPMVTSIDPPAGWSLSLRNGPVALSPDGRQIAFVAVDSSGTARLWVRALDTPDARPLDGTEGAASPFWSPDGKSLGFFAEDRLRRVDLAGGAPQTLADASWSAGGAWGTDGTILFAGHRGSSILRVSATGGSPVPVGAPRGREAFDWQAWPSWLPDGRHFLFFSFNGVGGAGPPSSIYVSSVDSTERARLVLPGVTHALATGDGRICYLRGDALWAQPFDAKQARPTGTAVRLADRVAHDSELGCGLFAVTPAGLLAYQGGGNADISQLAWTDRSGRTLGTLGPAGYVYAPRIAHDGTRVALDVGDRITANGDVWVFDVARGIGDPLTSDPANESAPVWSATDDRIYWFSSVGARGPGDIHARLASGAGREETVYASDSLACPLDVSPDGAKLVYLAGGFDAQGRAHRGLGVISLADRKASPWSVSAFDQHQARLSRDGRWIAFMSDETGRTEVYVARFPEGGEKWRVSTDGGISPVWRADGRELYYVSDDSRIMAVPFRATPSVQVGAPVALFRADLRPGRSLLEAEYDVTADGQRFLLNLMAPARAAGSITLVQNWSLRR